MVSDAPIMEFATVMDPPAVGSSLSSRVSLTGSCLPGRCLPASCFPGSFPTDGCLLDSCLTDGCLPGGCVTDGCLPGSCLSGSRPLGGYGAKRGVVMQVLS